MLIAALWAGCSSPTDAVTVLDAAVGESVNGVTAGVYARIRTGGAPDTLVALSSPAAERGSIHIMVSEGGVMTMQPVPALEVPGGGELALRPGERHGMLEGLLTPVEAGDTIEVTFEFASGRSRTVRAPVRPLLELRGR